MTIYLELEKNPTATAQQKGVAYQGGRIHHFEKKNVRSQRMIYRSAIREELEGREIPHYDGPVCLNVTFDFAIKDKKKWGLWKDTRPDCDNIVKLLQDVLSDLGIWDDDAQIASLTVKKKYSDRPGILIDVRRLIQP